MTASNHCHWVGIDLGDMPCNLACKYCSVEQGKDDDLHFPNGSDIANLFSAHIRPFLPYCRVLVFVSARTEPTLNKEALEELGRLSSKEQSRIHFHLLTNGTKPRKICNLAQAGWLVTVSYDGFEQIINRRFKGGTDSSWVVKETIRRLAGTTSRFSVRVTVTNWDSFAMTAEGLIDLGCEYIEVSENLDMGCGEKIPAAIGNSEELVKVASSYPGINFFTPISKSGACPLATNANRINWVFQDNRWRATCCSVDPNMGIDLGPRVQARHDGCLLKPINDKWREVSQDLGLKAGLLNWENVLMRW